MKTFLCYTKSGIMEFFNLRYNKSAMSDSAINSFCRNTPQLAIPDAEMCSLFLKIPNLSSFIYTIILYLFVFNVLSFAQPNGTRQLGEISFIDLNRNNDFTKVYLLGPGEQITVKNLCSNGEVAIGLKDYLDISNRLALIYQSRDSISFGIISRYEEMNVIVDEISSDLSGISDSLKKISQINLQPSIGLLNAANTQLSTSKDELNSAIKTLKEVNTDLGKVQTQNFFRNLIFLGTGLGAGLIIGLLIGG